MANGKIRFGKQSGGELALVIPDGIANTEVIVPESGVLATEQYVDGKYSGFKNYIINGGFDIWQRGESFSPGSSNFFTADRWVLDCVGAASGLSASKQPGLVGKNSLYIVRTGGVYMQAYQMVENQGNLSNKTFTFSALVRSVNNGTVKFNIADGRAATNFMYTQTPVALEANIPKEIVFTTQLGQVSADALFVGIVTTCTGLYIEAVQMEEGSVATPFEHRPFGLELSLCERYFKSNREYIGSGTPSSFVTVSSIFGNSMRVTPTLSNSNAATGFGTINNIYLSNVQLTFTGTGNDQGQLSLMTTLNAEL